MVKFNNITEAIDWLQNQHKFNGKKDLNLFKQAFIDLNIDLSNIKKIHVGGTNGKGSTASYINNVLVNNGKKVGLFTSPYLVTFNERIRINSSYITNDDLLSLINYFYNYNEYLYNKYRYKLSFFEILTLLSLKYFYDMKCDVIIMEIGIGGNLDSTNIINYDVTLITNIGFDHMKVLGNTLEEIALEKIKALKNNGHLIATMDEKFEPLIKSYISSISATYHLIDSKLIKEVDNNRFNYKDLNFNLLMLGDYQRKNAVLAYEGIKYLFDFEDENIIKYINQTIWQGRFEEIYPNIYIDGAHNVDAVSSLFLNVEKLFKNKKVTVVYSALKDKDINAMLNIIRRYNYEIILTSFPDFRFESLENFIGKNISYKPNSLELIKNLKNNISKDEVIIITGSLHFIGYIKQNIKEIDYNCIKRLQL